MQAWVSCSGGRTTACDLHALGGNHCGEQRGSDLKHSTTFHHQQRLRESYSARRVVKEQPESLVVSRTRAVIRIQTMDDVCPDIETQEALHSVGTQHGGLPMHGDAVVLAMSENVGVPLQGAEASSSGWFPTCMRAPPLRSPTRVR